MLEVEDCGRAAAGLLGRLLGDELVAAYLVGSGALGGVAPGQSDVDVVAVCATAPPAERTQAIVAGLGELAMTWPLRGPGARALHQGRGRRPGPEPAVRAQPQRRPAHALPRLARPGGRAGPLVPARPGHPPRPRPHSCPALRPATWSARSPAPGCSRRCATRRPARRPRGGPAADGPQRQPGLALRRGGRGPPRTTPAPGPWPAPTTGPPSRRPWPCATATAPGASTRPASAPSSAGSGSGSTVPWPGWTRTRW